MLRWHENSAPEAPSGVEWVTLLYLSSGPGIEYWLPLFSSIDLYTKTQSPLALLLVGVIGLYFFFRRLPYYPKEVTLLVEKPSASLGLSALLAATGLFWGLLSVERARIFIMNAEIKSMPKEPLWTQEDVPGPAGYFSAQPLIQS